MGNTMSGRRRARSSSAAATPGTKAAKKPFDGTFGKNPALNRADYIVSTQSHATVVKRPGQVAGEQFLIEDCTHCNIFVLDHCTSVQIDECHDCTIFIGPCTASLFVRNCSRMTLVCIVQQFRTRDCSDMAISLFSSTAPIIETSKKLRIGACRASYVGLQHHLDTAKFDVWVNKWSEIFDFTPAAGNWTPVEYDPSTSILMDKLPADVAAELGFVEVDGVLPITHGLHSRVSDQVVFVAVSTGSVVAAMNLATLAASGAAARLIQTRKFHVSPTQAKQLFGKKATTHIKHAAEAKDGIIVMEWAASEADVQALITHESVQSHASVLFVEAPDARAKVELCWNEWKEVI
ncbi:Aste57867_13266 [Aphanomyces stellatus]|uniref:Aste57867_13266 protein n=1 Tax=Aphanomyces stellatus TaxID=120398 RepID=A0A485KZR6_9STRA|nr:hypothetical protein As57867_013217 [Aphanomyces stellatus]VFT90106.1 Aste57867_13266 [Aphanomyces stellatus]